MRAFIFIVALVFSSVGFAQEEKPTIMVLEFEAEAKQKDSAKLLQAKLVSALAKDSRFTTLDIVDVQKGIELETQKSLISKECDISSCLTELANAFGADYILHGRFGAVGTRSVLSMQLFDATKTKSVARIDRDAVDSGAFLSTLEAMADELVTQEFGVYSSLSKEEASGEYSSMFLVGAGIVAAAGIGALATGGSALYGEFVLRDATSAREEKDPWVDAVVPLEIAAIVFVGVAALGAGFAFVGMSE